jgi:hypothetical protein
MQYESVVNTVNWTVHQLSKNLNIPLSYTQNTTINEILDYWVGEVPPISESFMQGFCIGNGGSKPVTSANGTATTVPHDQSPLNSGLYNMQPFVLRPKSNDLTSEQRANYAGRVLKTINGKEYWAYYIKLITLVDNSISKNIYKTTDGSGEAKPFIPAEEHLYPVPHDVVLPVDEEGNMENLSISHSVWVEKPITINFNSFDIEEYRNAIKILYGATEPAVIDEIGLLTFGKRSRTFSDKSGSYSITDAVNAQIAVFISVAFDFTRQFSNISTVFNIGNGEPLRIGTPSDRS